MPVVITTSHKGGSGKTTITSNLAAAAAKEGHKVLMLNLDPQQSLRHWWEVRPGDNPAMLDKDPAPTDLVATVGAAAKSFDWIFVDTPPAVPAWLVQALGAAQACPTPSCLHRPPEPT